MKPFIPDRLPIESINYASPDLITSIGRANRALAHYDALLEQSPSPDLLLAPLLRREAVLSSRIEGSQSTLSEVFQFEEDEDFAEPGERRDDLNEIRNYTLALNLGAAELRDRPFSLNLLKTLHGVLLGRGSVRGRTKTPGNFRAGQNWIGRDGEKMEQASFVPPEPILLTDCMENWEAFYLSNQPDPLIQAAMVHAQFELIHPFEDGNGRLGRLLVPLFLYGKKVITRPSFYPSAYLEKNRDAYMGTLRQLNQKPGNWDAWTIFFLEAISAQAKETSGKVEGIMALYEELKLRFIDLTHSQFATPLLDAIIENPIFRRTTVKKKFSRLDAPPSDLTIWNLLKKLTANKVLVVVRKGKGSRGTTYALEPLIQLLEENE